jgi:hypothetical protein
MTEPTCEERDLGRGVAVIWLWGLPVVGLAVTSALVNTGRLALPIAGGLFVAGTVWIAAGCWLNARHCGRVHCRLVSIVYPLLAIVGALYVAEVIRLAYFWDWYWGAFFALLIVAFGLERVVGKYT